MQNIGHWGTPGVRIATLLHKCCKDVAIGVRAAAAHALWPVSRLAGSLQVPADLATNALNGLARSRLLIKYRK